MPAVRGSLLPRETSIVDVAGQAPSFVPHTFTGPRVIGGHRNHPGELGTPHARADPAPAPASRKQTGRLRRSSLTPTPALASCGRHRSHLGKLDIIGARQPWRPHRQLGTSRAGSIARSSHLHRPSR
jgi:hypothetical protein